ncbi:1,2-dihydroxy-3-keto-5-methylthiopentene dioxygenase [Marinicellulosiphila megalodicopiae]|uniref:1,2-dihydroxy-3-keto-5-methylthiopentene dioxygenase n=1 Tax=Marinicellulosiphila megalodicopiae TaxID=2724896 RepID=UPI003BB04A49
MSELTIFNDSDIQADTQSSIFNSTDSLEIKEQLHKVGVTFETWDTYQVDVNNTDAVLYAYKADLDRIQGSGGYQTVDVISLDKGNPNAAMMRAKFLFEHQHSEDEVRFFVKGEGLFCLHIGEKVFQVLCTQGDLICVPANTKHWFDMGSDPMFTAIRFFNNEAGWVANSTESDIATKFPLLD